MNSSFNSWQLYKDRFVNPSPKVCGSLASTHKKYILWYKHIYTLFHLVKKMSRILHRAWKLDAFYTVQQEAIRRTTPNVAEREAWIDFQISPESKVRMTILQHLQTSTAGRTKGGQRYQSDSDFFNCHRKALQKGIKAWYNGYWTSEKYCKWL